MDRKKRTILRKSHLGKRATEFIDLLSEKSLCEEVDGKSFYESGHLLKYGGSQSGLFEKEIGEVYSAYYQEEMEYDNVFKGNEEGKPQVELGSEMGEQDEELIPKRRSNFTIKKESGLREIDKENRNDSQRTTQGDVLKENEKMSMSSTESRGSQNIMNSSVSNKNMETNKEKNKMGKVISKKRASSDSYFKNNSESLTKLGSQSPIPLLSREHSNNSQNIRELLSTMTQTNRPKISLTKRSNSDLPQKIKRSKRGHRGDSTNKFCRLKVLMEKFFLNQNICEEDLNLDNQSKLLFKKIIEKKNQYFPFGTAWNAEAIMSLSCSTSQKRNEEKLKYVFKLTLKNMKKQYRPKHFHFCGDELQGDYQKSASDDKELGFYCYHFRNFLQGGRLQYNLEDFPEKFIKNGKLNVEEIIQSCSSGHKHQEKNSQKKFLRSIEVINKDFVQALSLSESFMQEFKRFLHLHELSERGEKGIEILGDVNDIYKESTKLIRRKVELKIKQWMKTWNLCEHNDSRFENLINAEFSRKKYKLPWTMTDVRSAVHTVGLFLKTGSVKRN
jgi:hypothetical protein